MKKDSHNVKDFLGTPVGIVICFVVLFYVITFAVYYFYSPGPEERRTAAQSTDEISGISEKTAP